MLTVFLGAGFARVAGVPLTWQLFDEVPVVDRLTRYSMAERVVASWNEWHTETGKCPEEYLAWLQERKGPNWSEAVWFVSLVVALSMGRVQLVGGRPTITRHHLNLTTGVPIHETFWSTIFANTEDVGVVTTNYDILAERGLRLEPRRRAHRPGFHYGDGPERLEGGGYPSYAHIHQVRVSGTVPLYKLHGSISWEARGGVLHRFHDCRPAIKGAAAILAPVRDALLPDWLKPTWAKAAQQLVASSVWIFVGYSLPEYDVSVRSLLFSNSLHKPDIHVFDPNPAVAYRFESLLPDCRIQRHPGLPDGLDELEDAIRVSSVRA
jgi:hypothetical protein